MPRLVKSADVKIAKQLPDFVPVIGKDKFAIDPSGKVKRNTNNIFTLLTQSAEWKSVFAFDGNANRKKIISKPPFYTGNPQHFKPIDIEDVHYTRTRMHIEKNWGSCNKQDVINAISAACYEQVISPVRHYLEALPPQDPSLLNNVLERYFGVIPTLDEH